MKLGNIIKGGIFVVTIRKHGDNGQPIERMYLAVDNPNDLDIVPCFPINRYPRNKEKDIPINIRDTSTSWVDPMYIFPIERERLDVGKYLGTLIPESESDLALNDFLNMVTRIHYLYTGLQSGIINKDDIITTFQSYKDNIEIHENEIFKHPFINPMADAFKDWKKEEKLGASERCELNQEWLQSDKAQKEYARNMKAVTPSNAPMPEEKKDSEIIITPEMEDIMGMIEDYVSDREQKGKYAFQKMTPDDKEYLLELYPMIVEAKMVKIFASRIGVSVSTVYSQLHRMKCETETV